MKIKTISRSSDDYVPVSNQESARQPRNLDPDLHPFERAREYTRALNSVKMDKMFAAPFICQMGMGHVDGVYSMAKNPKSLGVMASGSGDGVVKLWNLGEREETFEVTAHENIVKGLCFTPQSQLLSCSIDGTVKRWDPLSKSTEPLQTYLSSGGLNSVDHHRDEARFITGGDTLQLWDSQRSKPVESLAWGADNINSVKFNMTETNICASTGNDRSIVIYDLRTTSPIQKMVTSLNNNAISWNPMEAYNFAVASEDHNAYLYDMRNLKRALNVYKDHVAAVMDLDFSPTGQELVTGSYDRTIRMFNLLEGHSKEIYHTKRMQRVMSVRYSMDSKYILSGSDDGNVRLWRAKANERMGVRSAKQQASLDYSNALVERYKHMPEIRKISKSRHLPQAIQKARDIKRTELDALKRRRDNRIRHSKPGTYEYEKEREKHIVDTAFKDESKPKKTKD